MKTLTATYEKGIFRPEHPVALKDATRVQILLPEAEPLSSDEMKRRFPNSWGVLSNEEADRIGRAIEEAHGQIDPDAWR